MIKKDIRTIVEKALQEIGRARGVALESEGISLEEPKRDEHGDLSTNVALVLAPRLKINPRELAAEIADRLSSSEVFDRVEVAGPGFINLFLKRSYIYSFLKEVERRGDGYGRSSARKKEKIQVEFVSANPTGPLHVGHGRGAAVGDALSSILEAAGHDVTREYYINDVGNQMELLGRSVYARYMDLVGREYPFPENGYKGEYIVEIAREILEREGERFKDIPEDEAIPHFIDFAKDSILDGIKRDLEDFGVRFDVWYSEGELHRKGKVDKTIEELRAKGLVYEKDGALWFKSTDFGDDKDRVLVKADGETTYFASDIAYHEEKFERGFDKVIDIWGADHHGYQPRMRAFVKAIGIDERRLSILLVQFVTLLRGGEKVSMSTRAGEFVTLREVMDEVGRDAARFFFLLRRCDAPLEFDLELAKRQAPENPIYYIQYAHARICSIFALAEERGIRIPSFEEIDTTVLNLKEEEDLIKKVLAYPEVVESCATNLAPHHLAFYLQELAAMFHSYYNSYRVVSQHPEDLPITLARLYLCRCIKTVIKNGLQLLGVSAPEKM